MLLFGSVIVIKDPLLYLDSLQMVCFRGSFSVDQRISMAKSVNSNSTDPRLKPGKMNKVHGNKKAPNSPYHPVCRQSRWAVIDAVILIAVIGASGFLLYPYMKFLFCKIFEIVGTILYIMAEEVLRAPMIYGCLGLSIFCVMLAVWAIALSTYGKCGKPNCRGLSKASAFDIELETEECAKNSSGSIKGGVKKGLFELPEHHHRELEAELKNMAPPNGRAVLVFRARCGCRIGRMEVSGLREPRKMKK